MQPRGRSQNGQQVAPRKAIDTNIRGIIPFSRSSTQAALLTCGARGENRAHEFLHLLYIQGPWAVRIVVDAVFKSPRTLVHPEVLKLSAKIPPLSVFTPTSPSRRSPFLPCLHRLISPWVRETRLTLISISTSPSLQRLQTSNSTSP